MSGCSCAEFDEDSGRWQCSVSGDGCMYFLPNSKRCAKEYGEGPDSFSGNDDEKLCCTCKYYQVIDEEHLSTCTCNDSEGYNDYTTPDDYCGCWEMNK